jgi:uncharacterized protein YdhG (YjbR/CyaY superfamily)
VPDYASVDEYITRQSEVVQPMLRDLRAAVRMALPHSEEGISGYNMPTYKVGGKSVAFFAAAKKHCALYGVLRDGFEEELRPYGDVSKGTVRFPLHEKVPVGLVMRLVKARAAQQAAK